MVHCAGVGYKKAMISHLKRLQLKHDQNRFTRKYEDRNSEEMTTTYRSQVARQRQITKQGQIKQRCSIKAEVFPSILQPDAFVKYIKKRNPCFVPEILSCRIPVPTVSASTPAAAVSGEELSEDGLERFVHRHLVVFAHVVSAGRTGVDLGFERSLKAFLRRGGLSYS